MNWNLEKNNNKILEWSEDLSVKDTVLDAQHQKLLKEIGILSFALRSGEGAERINEIMSFLDEYLKVHLKYEEDYMLKHDYPFFEEHKKTHEFAKEKYKELKEQMSNECEDNSELAVKVEKYMRDWWINHIATVDKKYVDFISQKSEGRL